MLSLTGQKNEIYLAAAKLQQGVILWMAGFQPAGK
jgi:hypothetical protein